MDRTNPLTAVVVICWFDQVQKVSCGHLFAQVNNEHVIVVIFGPLNDGHLLPAVHNPLICVT